MTTAGQVKVTFNEGFFDQILNSAGVQSLTKAAAKRVLDKARSTAPVDTGAYRAGLALTSKQAAHRKVWLVVGADPKTLLVESKTGNLARAAKAARG